MPSPSSPEMASFSSYSPGSSPPRKEQPLFTLKQVTLICERMLKEREAQVTEEYDKVLREKLAGLLLPFVLKNIQSLSLHFQFNCCSWQAIKLLAFKLLFKSV